MEDKNRIDFLAHIGEDKVFGTYIPDHHNEIYALYCMLDLLGIDYNNITFYKPKATDTTFSFLCDFKDQKDFNTITAYADMNKKVDLSFCRNYKFYLSVKQDKDHTQIKFKRIYSEVK